ncbi:unnamed protein product, partial [Rotaria sp. Silwood1]
LEDNSGLISTDNLCHTIQKIKNLEIPIRTKDQMLDIIDQFVHIDNFEFICDDFPKDDYLEVFIEKLDLHWLKNNSNRFGMKHFIFRQGEQYQYIQMSIGGPGTKKYSEYPSLLTE